MCIWDVWCGRTAPTCGRQGLSHRWGLKARGWMTPHALSCGSIVRVHRGGCGPASLHDCVQRYGHGCLQVRHCGCSLAGGGQVLRGTAPVSAHSGCHHHPRGGGRCRWPYDQRWARCLQGLLPFSAVRLAHCPRATGWSVMQTRQRRASSQDSGKKFVLAAAFRV